MAKNLMINCASCDARNVREENYANYEKISINCSTLLTNPEAKTIMSKLPFEINCASILDLPEGVELRSINGRSEIRSSDIPATTPYYLLVNGSLDIGSDTRQSELPTESVLQSKRRKDQRVRQCVSGWCHPAQAQRGG